MATGNRSPEWRNYLLARSRPKSASDEKPKRPERHVTTTWQSFEEYCRDRPLLRRP
jgi:hypothetical protein